MTIVNCAMCGKMFRNERRLNKHIMRNRCKAAKDYSIKKSAINEIIVTKIPPKYNEHVSPYNYNISLLTGNRHYNTGFINTKKDPRSRAAI